MSQGTPSSSVTIVLATTIPSIVLIVLAVVLCYRVRRRKSRLFKRGITPIDDEEIESWKVDKADEKSLVLEPTTPGRHYSQGERQHRQHEQSNSVSSIQKPASVIVYQNHSPGNPRMSEELSPRSISHGKQSVDIPQTPVLARAPNARPGLTDETIQGEDAFIPQTKRHTSRLAKSPRSPRHNRSRSTATGPDQWYGYNNSEPSSPRQSAETFPRASASHPALRSQAYEQHPQPQRSSLEDGMYMGGLSPRPLIHKSEIGRAIG